MKAPPTLPGKLAGSAQILNGREYHRRHVTPRNFRATFTVFRRSYKN